MGCRVYAHLEVEGRTAFAVPVQVQRPEETQFGTIKQELLRAHLSRFPDEQSVEYGDCCFWNQDLCPIPDRSSVAVHCWEHNDFFLRPLPQGASSAGALQASQKTCGELSYYYAHDRGQQSLISKPQQSLAAAPAPKREPLKAPGAEITSKPARHNFKQSPFGTDITGYDTITTYTWEDHDDTVKVLLPLEGVGKLEPSQIRSQFGERCFEVLIEGWEGKKLRFATYKTHGEMTPEECKHVVRANRVNLVLKKAKEKDVWFDLFKKRAIGDDDDP